MIPSNIKALILDMDGVVWKADAPIGNLPETFARIRERGLKFVFATNNGTKTPEEYRQKLSSLWCRSRICTGGDFRVGGRSHAFAKISQGYKNFYDRRTGSA